jgi:hypothetical protein
VTVQEKSKQLIKATEEGKMEDVVSAIESGVDINYRDKYRKLSAIDIAWHNAFYGIM